MTCRLSHGILAGLVAGAMFGVMIQMMSVPVPGGGSMSMMAMIGQVIGTTDLAVAWKYHLFNSAVIGVLFALALGPRLTTFREGALWGGGYGMAWWVLGAQILMPLALQMPIFSPLLGMPLIALMSLMGHTIYGVLLGVGFVKLESVGSCTTNALSRKVLPST